MRRHLPDRVFNVARASIQVEAARAETFGRNMTRTVTDPVIRVEPVEEAAQRAPETHVILPSETK